MATKEDNGPRAVKIIDVQNGRLFLDTETLRRILLCDEIKDKKVCVISVTGAFRQGKSFLLNFFIRYLTVTSETTNCVDWLSAKAGPISGFSSKGGSAAVTSGILIWSEIFLRRLPSGEEVAIILMDTQGVFDNQTEGKKDSDAAVFALSTLISSVQIYNLKDNINSLSWDCLEYFLNYAQLLTESGNLQKPFQHLLFLIRDWPDEDEYPYGLEGGNMYMDRMLNVRERNNIHLLFNRLNCFLLPHPGLKVLRIRYNGETDVIEPTFIKCVRTLTNNILTSENLVTKVLNGDYVEVKHLVNLFETYCNEFNKGDVLEEATLLEANAKVQHMMAMEQAEGLYESEMKEFHKQLEKNPNNFGEDSLSQAHEKSKTAAVNSFEKRILMGGDQMKQESKQLLEHKINEKFAKVCEYLKQMEMLRIEKEQLRKKYKEQMEKLSQLEQDVAEVKEEKNRLKKEYEERSKEFDEKMANLQKELKDTHGSVWTKLFITAFKVGLSFILRKLL